MNTQKNIFLQLKKEDYIKSSVLLPSNLSPLKKLFAKGLGTSAAKLIKVYELLFANIYLNENIQNIQKYIWRIVFDESKIQIKLPFGKIRTVRICGLVALNYTQFFETEIELYSLLHKLLKEKKHLNNKESIFQLIEKEAPNYKQQLKVIINKKKQSIYDFEVLMGISSDHLRFDQLTQNMHKKMKRYFSKIVNLHQGKSIFPSWPFAFKEYTWMIQNSFLLDSISFKIEIEIRKHCNFQNPNSITLKNDLNSTFNEINQFNRTFSSTFNYSELSFIKKWKVLSVVPVASLYLSAMEAQVPDIAETIQHAGFTDVSIERPASGATTIALALGSISDGDSSGDNFTTYWSIAFFSLIPTFTD